MMPDRTHISEQDWAAYAMGGPDEALSFRVRAHLETCPECAGLAAQLAAWPERLAAEGLRLRSALEVSEAEVERMLAAAMEKVGIADRRQGAGFAEGIAIMRALLEPVIGGGITRAALDRARDQAMRENGGGNNWGSFVTQLSATIQSVCGTAAGRLANRAGMAIGI